MKPVRLGIEAYKLMSIPYGSSWRFEIWQTWSRNIPLHSRKVLIKPSVHNIFYIMAEYQIGQLAIHNVHNTIGYG